MRGAEMRLCLLLFLVVEADGPAWAQTVSNQDLTRARGQLMAGDAASAVDTLKPLLSSTDPTAGSPSEALFVAVDALRQLGRNDRAWMYLEPYLTSEAAMSAERARVLVRAGGVRLAQGDLQSADRLLQQALELEMRLPESERAGLHNEIGLLQMARQDPVQARKAFGQAVTISTAGSPLQIRYRLNLALTLVAGADADAALQEADAISSQLEQQPDTSRTTRQRIALGTVYHRAVTELDADPRRRLDAYREASRAANAAGNLGDDRLLAYANVLLGALYEAEGRPADSLSYARRAVFAAQRAQDQEALYRAEWLVARSLLAVGDSAGSLQAYRRTVDTLRKIRPELDAGESGAFRAVVEPVYYQYADVLMRNAAAGDPEAKPSLLREALQAVEELKVAEIDDYFGNQCVATRSTIADLRQVDSAAAVLYPVILEDRLELLLYRGAEISDASVPVGRSELTGLVRDLRLNLQADTGTRTYIEQARSLYGLLVAPFERELADVSTLVFVPDGPLRTIPLAALHDGDNYVIERFAVATTPGLTLTDPEPLAGEQLSVFAGGVSDAVQGFPALPGVERELAALSSGPAVEVYRNHQFSLDLVRSRLSAGGYQIAHFATHGEFGGSYADSYLLTYEDRISVNELSASIQARQLKSGALELLVMSACETAAGDDRAALGLAGVAIRSGASSALATLWAVDDEAASLLVRKFYSALRDRRLSKSASLRQAQLALLRQDAFAHPSNWSPFLLIGNWL